MMSIIGRLFSRPTPQLEPENPERKATRELKSRLIEEHTSANIAGRARIEEQALVGTARYLDALNGAMVILGDRMK